MSIKRRLSPKETSADKKSQRILEIHQKRLQILEEQAALFGTLCPPHILIEIDMLNKKLGRSSADS